MKKIVLSIITLILFYTVSFAQRPDNTTVGVFKYIQLPLSPLPKEYESYYFEASSQWDDPYRKDQIYNDFFISGYSKKKSGETQFKVVFEEYPFRVSSPEEGVSVEKRKVDGVEKSVNNYYLKYSIQYRCRAEIYDANNEVIYSQAWDFNDSYTTNAYSSRDQAYNQFNADTKKRRETALNDAITKASNDINNKYGFPLKQITIELYNVKPKKFEYPEFVEAFNAVKNNFNIIATNEHAIEEAKVKFQPAIDKWNEALKQGEPENKKARIDADVMCCAYYNIAMTYFLLKDYATAIESMNKCIALDPGFSDAKRKIGIFENFKNRAEKNGK